MIQRYITHRISIHQDGLGIIAVDAGAIVCVMAAPHICQLPCVQIHEPGLVYWIGTRIDAKNSQVVLGIAVAANHLLAGKPITKERLRNAAIDWDQHRLVIFIAILVDHDQNFA